MHPSGYLAIGRLIPARPNLTGQLLLLILIHALRPIVHLLERLAFSTLGLGMSRAWFLFLSATDSTKARDLEVTARIFTVIIPAIGIS